MDCENENLYTKSRSHDQDDCNVHIWLKPFKTLLLKNRKADGLETPLAEF